MLKSRRKAISEVGKKLFLLVVVASTGLLLSGCTQWLNKANRAGLQVITNDVAASVFLDGQYLDRTPYIGKELQPGTFNLRIEPEDSNLVPYNTTVTLRAGLLTVVTWKPGTRPELSGGVTYELEKLNSRKQTELSIASIPDGAIVTIDGGEKEFTPLLTSEIIPGTHDIEISLPSYETQQHTINIVEGHRLNVLVKLAKNPNPEDIAQQNAAKESETADDSSTDPLASAAASLGNENDQGTSRNTSSQSAQLTTAPKPRVTIKATNFFVEGKEVLRVRGAAGANGAELGFAPVGSQYSYSGETQSGWYQIDFNGEAGWVSGQYATLEE